jgi:hypothetical protein
LRLGLLVECERSRYAHCTDCGEFSDEVFQEADDRRYYVDCPECGCTEIDPRDLQRWTTDYHPLIALLRRELHTRGEWKIVVPGKLWQLGRAALHGAVSRPIYLGRSFQGPQSRDVLAQLPTGRSPLLFAISRTPEEGLPGIEPERIFPLGELVYLDGEDLRLDVAAIEAQVRTFLVPEEGEASRPRIRSSRAEAIDKIKKELHEHILSMKSFLAHSEDRLPRLTQQELGERVGLERSVVSRALRDRSDPLLPILWQTVNDPDAIRQYHRRI